MKKSLVNMTGRHGIVIPELMRFDEDINIGTILEQNWMLYEIADRFGGGKLVYVFPIDRDVYTLDKDGVRYAFLQAHGSSIIACYAEEMTKRNAKRIYRLGTCGSLQRDANIGDVVLSSAAIRDEGTSNQYVAPYFPAVADPHLVTEFERRLGDKGIPIHTGITWTTDGRFVESNEKISSFSRMGVKSVDMETSALLTVCYLHGIPALSISVVTDKPIADLEKDFKGEIPDAQRNRRMLSERVYQIVSSILDSSNTGNGD